MKISLPESHPLSAAHQTSQLQVHHYFYALSADHIPIIISIKRNVVRVNAAKRTYVKFSKANFLSFREYLEIGIGRCLSHKTSM